MTYTCRQSCVLDGDNQIIDVNSMEMNDTISTTNFPDNIVQLCDGKILMIARIVEEKQALNIENKKIIIYGYIEVDRKSVFDTPFPSEQIGIIEIKKFSDALQSFSAM